MRILDKNSHTWCRKLWFPGKAEYPGFLFIKFLITYRLKKMH